MNASDLDRRCYPARREFLKVTKRICRIPGRQGYNRQILYGDQQERLKGYSESSLCVD
jgi:hypothetical protein